MMPYHSNRKLIGTVLNKHTASNKWIPRFYTISIKEENALNLRGSVVGVVGGVRRGRWRSEMMFKKVLMYMILNILKSLKNK